APRTRPRRQAAGRNPKALISPKAPRKGPHMTKFDMVLKIVQQTGLEQATVGRVVQLTLDAIIEALATEGRLELRGFGVFEVRVTKARKARNPRTGVEVPVPEGRRVRFRAGKVMEERVDGVAVAPARTSRPLGVR
ncbi:MAG: integration host factor subunit beta, partial [Planctomycetota bacterium]|nr:integration host factor subunit beta [Planctomycetota bacterium]